MSKVKSRGMTPYVVSRMCAEYETARNLKTEEQVAGVIHK